MGGKKKGRSLKRNHQVNVEEGSELQHAPHSFVIHRGLSCPYIQDLTSDFRRIMEPFTAINLKERKSNKIKDFVGMSGYFHVSHLCIFNKTATQLCFKMIRLPRGPTLTFRVHQFTLSRDIIASSRKQFVDEQSFHQAPMLVMNNFTSGEKHLNLIATTFQNMFPVINLATVNISNIKRCVLISYNPITKLIDVRHYSIIVVPIGLTRGVKKVVLGKIPNLSRCEDIADLFTQSAMSDSEVEDEEASHVLLPQDMKRKGNLENNKSAIRLYEIGPRLTLELIKIEDGLLTGEVFYHEVIVKSEQEVEEIAKRREKKKKLKEHRQNTQMQNKIKKDKIKEIKKKPKGQSENKPSELEEQFETNPDNDAQYYKDEVGEEPDEELFKTSDQNSRKRVRLPKHMMAKESKAKKIKLDENSKGDRRSKSKNNGRRRDSDNPRRSNIGKKGNRMKGRKSNASEFSGKKTFRK